MQLKMPVSMRNLRSAWLAGPLIISLLSPLSGAAQNGGRDEISPQVRDAVSGIEKAPPGEGVVCGWAFMSLVQQVGRRCYPGQDKAFQAQVDQSVAEIDRYVMQNGRVSQADVDRFKSDQGGGQIAAEQLCKGDAAKLYQGYRTSGGAGVRALTHAMTARPAKPTWGTCT